MKEKKYLLPLIGEFIIIVILAVLSFDNSSDCKCENNSEVIKDNYIYKDEIDYECVSKDNGIDSEYIINKKIKTDIKGKIINIRTEHQYVYSNQEKYNNMKETYEIDETKFDKKFDDENKMMVLTEKEEKTEDISRSIIDYEEFLLNSGYTCNMINEQK